MEVVNAKKADLMKNSPEFKAIMDARVRENKMWADESGALHKAKMAEATANSSRSKAMSRVRGAIPDSDLDDFVARTRFKMVDPEVLGRRLEEVLWCPICQKKDAHNNIINDVLSCASCFHKLVPKSELKDYPRKYRRNWLRRRKK